MFNLEEEIKKETTVHLESLAYSVPLLSNREYVMGTHEERAAMTKRYLEACRDIQRLAVEIQRKREAE